MHSRGIFVALALSLTGCTSTTVSSLPLGAETFPPQPEDHPIAIYETAAEVPRSFVKVGRVSAHRTGAYDMPQISQIGEVIGPMKREARKLGADALVLRGGFEVNSTMEVRTTTDGSKDGGSTAVTRGTSSGGNVADVWGHNAVAIRFVNGKPAPAVR
jgi:hypothetical protein